MMDIGTICRTQLIHHANSNHTAQKNLLKKTIRDKLNIKPVNLAKCDEKSFSFTVAQSELNDAGNFQVGYVLRRADQSSVLPPGAYLV